VKVAGGGRFDVRAWRGDGEGYVYTVKAGVVTSSRMGGGIY